MLKFLTKYCTTKAVSSKASPRNRGFTLVEMVVTVAVMAILVGISTPSIFEFMRQRDNQSEEIAMGEVRKALQAYLADTGELPTDTGTGTNAWFNLLAGYSGLSSNEIANDVWGRPRKYIVYINSDRKLFGNTVNVYYATVHSMGINGKAEETYIDTNGANVTITGLAVTASAFDTSTDTTWWKNLGANSVARINAYSALRAGGDDQLMRYTNYAEVLDRYNATVERLDRLTQALETYARSGYAGRVSECSVSTPDPLLCANGIPEQTIYYPRSRPISGAAEAASIKYSDNTIIVDNTVNDTQRRNYMVNLMNRLGLPGEYCCSALENSTLDKLPKPFYYFSNPRARTGTGCAARPAVTDGKLPARITTKNSGDSNSDRTCG